jgi:recombination protein RecA
VYAKKLGVNVDELLVSQPDNGEQALEIAEALVRSGAIEIIVVDSVAALVPRAEIEGDMGDSHVGLHARLMSQALRKLAGAISKSNCVAVFINQLREKVGVMYGNPEVTTGGRALKFYASVRIDIRRVEQIKNGTEVIGNRTKAKVVKNKVAPPFRKVEFEIMFGKGISAPGSILDAAVKYDIIDKKGAWYSYGEEKIAQGKEAAKAYLEDRPDFMAELEEKLRKIMFPDREFLRAASQAAAASEPAKTGDAGLLKKARSRKPAVAAVAPELPITDEAVKATAETTF